MQSKMTKGKMVFLVLLLSSYTLLIVMVTISMKHGKNWLVDAPSLVSGYHGYLSPHQLEVRGPRTNDAARVCDFNNASQITSWKVDKNCAGSLTTEQSAKTVGLGLSDEQMPQSPRYVRLDSNQGLDLHCKQCALVFSSGHLLHSRMGQEIDSAECVIRQNSAPVRYHWKDVGARTTVRVIGHVNVKRELTHNKATEFEILKNRQTRTSIVFIPWLYDELVNKTTNGVYTTARRFVEQYPDVAFYFHRDGRLQEIDRMFLKETGLNRTEIETWYSTGFASMLLALDVCDDVICYGLSDADFCKREPRSKVKYHYYDVQNMLECDYTQTRETLVKGGHKFLTERRLYARWATNLKRDKSLKFRAPSWPKSAFTPVTNFTSAYLEVYRSAKAKGTFANYSSQGGMKAGPVPGREKGLKVRQPLLHVVPRRMIKTVKRT